MKIVNHYDIEFSSHRESFTRCPHCKKEFSHEFWMKSIFMIILNPKFWKAENVVIVSECQACFEKSWIHLPFDMTAWILEDDYNGNFIDILDKHIKKYFENELKRWNKSLCLTCQYLESEINFKRAYRDCTQGCGPVCSECEKYKEAR